MKKHSRFHDKIIRRYCLSNIKRETKYLIKHGKYSQPELYYICNLINNRFDTFNVDLTNIALSKLQSAYHIVNMIYAEERASNIFN